MTIVFTASEKREAPGKLADAELHFDHREQQLIGLRLLGFAIWESREGEGRHVTFPSRPYWADGKRRAFALVRPITDTAASDRIRDLILAAYADFERSHRRS